MNELRRLGQGLPLPEHKRDYVKDIHGKRRVVRINGVLPPSNPRDYHQCDRILPGGKPEAMGEVATMDGKSFWLRDHSLDRESQECRYKNRIDWKRKGDRYADKRTVYPPRVVVRIAEKQVYPGESRKIEYKGKDYVFTCTPSGRLTFQGKEVRS